MGGGICSWNPGEREARPPAPSATGLLSCLSSCHALALAWTFSYLLFFRALSLLGLPTPTPFTNAVQLLLTLKVRLPPHPQPSLGARELAQLYLLLPGEAEEVGRSLPLTLLRAGLHLSALPWGKKVPKAI